MARKNHRHAQKSNKNFSNSNMNNNMKQNNTKETNTTAPVIEETAEQKLVRKAYELAPEWKISQIAKRKFMNLPTAFQSSVGKEACIKEALSGHKELIPDPTRYWIWLIDETNKLTRVWDFTDTCDKAGLNPQTVAQHLILEGKSVCNAIRLEGLAAYGSNIRMFVDPLFVDEFNLFSGKVPTKAASADVTKKNADE